MREGSFRKVVQSALEQEREQTYIECAMVTTRQSPYKRGAEQHLRKQGIRVEGKRIIVSESIRSTSRDRRRS